MSVKHFQKLAVALETAMVDGNGLNQPVGMTRNFTGSLDSSKGYSRKTATKVTAFDKETYGTLLSTLATNPNGGTRTVSEVILIVNPVDYFTKVMPATTVLAPDGTYRNDVFPFPHKGYSVGRCSCKSCGYRTCKNAILWV